MSVWIPRILLGFGIAAVAAAVVSISVGEGGPGAPRTVGAVNDVQRLFAGIEQEDASLGPADAELEIDVFNDIQCRSCAEWQIEVVDELVERHARTGEARLVFRHFPVTERETTLGALAAEAAGEQDRQWQYVDTFVRNQELAIERGVDEELLREVAEAVPNLELERWERDFDDPAAAERVREDGLLAAELEFPGEPAIVVTGPGGQRELIESPSLDEVEAAIAEVR